MNTLQTRLAALADQLDSQGLQAEADLIDICLYSEASVVEKIQGLSSGVRDQILKRLKDWQKKAPATSKKLSNDVLNDPKILHDDLEESKLKDMNGGSKNDIAEDIPDDVAGWDGVKVSEEGCNDGWTPEEEEWFRATFEKYRRPQAA